MKKEFFKLSRNLIVFVWVSILIITIFGIAFYYNVKTRGNRDVMAYVPKYSNADDVKSIIRAYQENLKDAELKNATEEIKYDKEVIKYMTFIYNNYIPYENISDNFDRANMATTPGLFERIISVTFYFLLAAVLLLPLIVINADYVLGTYKPLFIGCKKRRKVMLEKYAVCVISTLIAYFTCVCLPALISLSYYDADIKIITEIFNNVLYITEGQYLLLTALGLLEIILFICTIVFSVSVFIRPIVWSGFVSLAICGLSILLSGIFDDRLKWLGDILATPMGNQTSDSILGYFSFVLIRVAFSIALFISSLLIFEKRDL